MKRLTQAATKNMSHQIAHTNVTSLDQFISVFSAIQAEFEIFSVGAYNLVENFRGKKSVNKCRENNFNGACESVCKLPHSLLANRACIRNNEMCGQAKKKRNCDYNSVTNYIFGQKSKRKQAKETCISPVWK